VLVEAPSILATDVARARAEGDLRAALEALPWSPPARVRIVLDTEARDLDPDGFALRASADASVEVRSRDVRGASYGLLELARLVRLGRWRPGEALDRLRNPAFELRLCSMHDNPGEAPFDTRFRDPEVVFDLGFNGMIVHGLSGLCTYDAFDARLLPAGSPMRAQVLASRERVRRLVERAKRNHLLVFLNGDELCLPARAIELYGDEVLADADRQGHRPISPSKPKVHALVRATFEELIAAFPEVDGYQVRTGEIYTQSEPMLVGDSPNLGSDETCADWSREDKLRALHRTISDVVCREHGKRFNLRLWDYYDSAHSVPERWREFSDPIEPSALVTFSFKHPKTDYWRWNPVNPNFGVGSHPQWAEFQMAREYEGKGAFPSYLGRYLAEGPTECAPSGGLAFLHAKGVRGAWCWARGGGQRGPFPANEDWVALNLYAFARLLWDPAEDPWRLAGEWGTLELGLSPGSSALGSFVEVQRLSEQALLSSRYLGVLIEKGHFKRGSGWTPDGNWSRDDKIGVRADVAPASALYKLLKADGTVAQAIDERRRALELWRALVDEFQHVLDEAGGGERLLELYHTALYGQALFDTTNHAFVAGWSAYAWDDGGRTDAALEAQAREHVAAARRSWSDYRERVCKLPGVATPYEEFGFTPEWDAIEALLDSGR
jgi:hypothetical protein